MSVRRAVPTDGRYDVVEMKDTAVLYPKVVSVKLAQRFKRSLFSETFAKAIGRKAVFKKLELFMISNHAALLSGLPPAQMAQVRGVSSAQDEAEQLARTIEEVSAA
ncbi:hypothetical protein [Neotabrizicola sp. VNH66]|uniref:hypothetical protein n=1 Tax=Neotabrizicola sp. VNH66 TaxID=3400918 RepID=UPI003C0B31C0